MFKRLLIISLVSGALMACQRGLPDEQMQKLDQLESRLDSISQTFHQIDSAEAFEAIENYEANLSFLQQELKDTLPRESAFFVDTYYKMRKAMRKFARNYTMLNAEIDLSEKQLEDLRRDAKNGLIEEEQFEDYLAIEGETIDKLEAATNDVIGDFSRVLPYYEKKNSRIDSLVRVYQQKQAEGG